MEYSEQPKPVEHAYSTSQRHEPRRKLFTQRVKTAIAATAIVGSFLGVKAMESPSTETASTPDTYYSGRVEIVMSDGLYVRKEPIVIRNRHDEPNNVEWSQIKEINGQNVEGGKSFTIDKPLITYGDDPETQGAGKGSWITFDAKVNNEDEKLYVSLGTATNGYVKPIESGVFKKVDPLLTPTEDLGKVTVNP